MPLEDFIKPLKLEVVSDFDEFTTETNPSEDGILCAGIGIESSAITLEKNAGSHLTFKDQYGEYTLSQLAGTKILDAYVASDIAFNNATNSFVSSDLQGAIEEIDDHINYLDFHFTESSIVHSNIQGVGTYQHSDIDTHIDDSNIHFSNLDGLSDVNIVSPANNDVLTYITASGLWKNSPSGGTINHSDLQGIGNYTHSGIDAHIYNSNIHFSGIGDLSDVYVSSIQDRHLLIYSSSLNTWRNVDEGSVIATGEPMYVAQCGYQGNARGKWLEFFQNIPSNDSGFVIASDTILEELSVAIKDWVSNGTFTFNVYKNDSSLTSLSVVYPQKVAYTGDLNLNLSASDVLSVYGSNATANVNYPVFNIFLKKEFYVS